MPVPFLFLQGCDGDWQNLLTSKRHHESGKQLSFVLGIENISPETHENNKKDNGKPKLNVKSPLFKHMSHIFLGMTTVFRETNVWKKILRKFLRFFSALHLLYEDSKLNKFCWKSCPLLASFLSRLSADLNLQNFVEHYWKEFPTMCHMSVEKAKTEQIDLKMIQDLELSMLIDPPSIFKTLEAIIKGQPIKDIFPIITGVTSRYQFEFLPHEKKRLNF